MKKGKLFVFSAPSGAGKTTIVRYVLSEFPEFRFSVSSTTRRPREHEIDNVDYYFVSEEEFTKEIKDNAFIEWEKFYDYYYGTPKKPVIENIESGISTVFEVDVKGALSIKKVFNDAVLIFIAPPNFEELKRRLIARRTESETDLRKRLERAELELSYTDKFDYVVVNDRLDKAKSETREIIIKELNQGR